MKQIHLYLFGLLLSLSNLTAQQLPSVSPEQVGMSSLHLRYADEAIQNAIADKEMPGAVLAVVKDGKMAYLKAYGNKEVYPKTVKMETNTVFDLASVTKPVATATSVMVLIERGQLRLLDKVNQFIPGFEGWKGTDGKKTDIRIVDLLTHTSGLPSYAPVETLQKQYGSPNQEGLINYISTCRRDFEPQTNMQYSCLNYITLQRIVEKVSKQNLRDFAKQNIFDVLGMKHTDYQPTGETLARVAPTEKQKDGMVLRGIVHDPLARVMNGGVSGNAGLFSDANDLALFAAALINDGELNGKRILSRLGVQAMRTIPRSVSQFGRTLGWDVFSPYASNNGDLLSTNAYGHTGYTGTSLVIDPDNNLAVILLTNRAHPDDKGNVVRLRSLVANAVAASIQKPQENAVAEVIVPKPQWSYELHYKKRLEQFATEPLITKKDIIMLGNSLTEGGGDWNGKLSANNIRNRGISGDNTQGILNRLDEIIEGEPQKIFLLIGVNDISMEITVDSVLKNITEIVAKIKKESPRTKIYLQSLLPTNQSFGRYKKLDNKTAAIIEANLKIEHLAKIQRATFINLYPYFLEKGTQSLRKELTTDGLHLNSEGYEVWSKVLKKYL